MQQSNIKPVSSGFKQKALRSKSYVMALISNTSTQRCHRERRRGTILETMFTGYDNDKNLYFCPHSCSKINYDDENNKSKN